jgi:hypothetical protein
MKPLVCVSAFVWLSCAVLLAQSNGSKQGLPCATPNPASGYAPPIKFRDSNRKINVYNVDNLDTGKHNPVCLSKKGDDAMLWVSGSSKKFKIKFHPWPGADPGCGQHPFQIDPPPDLGDGWFSGSLNPKVPDYCVYDVEFKFDGGGVSDPHIQTTP